MLVNNPANDQKHFGMLCWLLQDASLVQNFSREATASRSRSMISIIDAGPRLPILGIAGNGLRFILVVPHAPHTGAELETVSAYRQHVHSIWTAKYANWNVFLLLQMRTASYR
jgi:hypothetical protein